MKKAVWVAAASGLVACAAACGSSGEGSGSSGAGAATASTSGATGTMSTSTSSGGATARVVATIDLPGAPYGMAFNPTTKKAYFGCSVRSDAGFTVPAGIAVVDEGTNAVTTTIPTLNDVWSIAVDATTNTIYATDATGFIDVIDGAADTVKTTIQTNADDLAVDEAHGKVYALAGESVVVIDGASSAVTATYPIDLTPAIDLSNGAHRIAVDPASQTVFVVGQDASLANTIITLDGTTGAVKSTASPTGYPTDVLPFGDTLAVLYVGAPSGITIGAAPEIPLDFTPTGFASAGGSIYVAGYDPATGNPALSVVDQGTRIQVSLSGSGPSLAVPESVLGGILAGTTAPSGSTFTVTLQADPSNPSNGTAPRQTVYELLFTDP